MKQEKEGLTYYHVKLEVLPVADWGKSGIPFGRSAIYDFLSTYTQRTGKKEIWEKKTGAAMEVCGRKTDRNILLSTARRPGCMPKRSLQI